LDDTGTGIRLRNFDRRLVVQHPQPLAQPAVCLSCVAKNVFRQSLNSGQTNKPVGFLDGETLPPRLSMPLRARRNDVLPDLLIREPDALDAGQHAQWNAAMDEAG